MYRPLLLLFAVFVLMAGCQRVKSNNIVADIPLPAITGGILPTNVVDSLQNLPAGTKINAWINIPPIPFPSSSASEVISLNTSASNIISVNLDKLVVQLNPRTNHFDFMDSVMVILSSSTPTSGPVQVAVKYGVTPTDNVVFFDVDSTIDIQNYYMMSTLYLSVKAHFIKVPPANATMEYSGNLHLVAKPLK